MSKEILGLSSLTGFAIELKNDTIFKHSFVKVPNPNSTELIKFSNLFNSKTSINLFNENSKEYSLGVEGYYLLYTFDPSKHNFDIVEYSEIDVYTEHKKRLRAVNLSEISILCSPTEPTTPKYLYIHTTTNSIYNVVPALVRLI